MPTTYMQKCVLQLVPADYVLETIEWRIRSAIHPRILIWEVSINARMLKELSPKKSFGELGLERYKRRYPNLACLKKPYQPRLTESNSPHFDKIMSELKSWVTIT